MSRSIVTNAVKTWTKFNVPTRKGVSNLRIIDLPKGLEEDYVDFKIKYYVKNELTHRTSGLNENSKALDEYREFLQNTFVKPPYYSVICCPEENGVIVPNIIATCTIRLLEKDKKPYMDYQFKTEEVKRYIKLEQDWNDVYPASILMDKYNVNKAFEFLAMAVHPDYSRLGIGALMCSIRTELCERLNVPLNVAWTTSDSSHGATRRSGWKTEYEISATELANILNVKFENPPPGFIYKSYFVKSANPL